MEKHTIKEIVKKVIEISYEFDSEKEKEEAIKNKIEILEYNNWPINDDAPVSFDVAVTIAFILGIVEGFIEKDLVKVEENE